MRCTDCYSPIKPVVAIDIDGTMADYHSHFVKFLDQYYDQKFPTDWRGDGDWEDYLGLSREKYREAKLAFRQGGWKRMEPLLPYAASTTAMLQAEGAEVWVTTTRPWMRHDATDPDTQEWLRRNGIHWDFLLYDERKYRTLSERVGPGRVVGVVDDLKEQCLISENLFGNGVVFQIIRPHNRSIDAQYARRVESLRQARDLIIQNIHAWRISHGQKRRGQLIVSRNGQSEDERVSSTAKP